MKVFITRESSSEYFASEVDPSFPDQIEADLTPEEYADFNVVYGKYRDWQDKLHKIYRLKRSGGMPTWGDA